MKYLLPSGNILKSLMLHEHRYLHRIIIRSLTLLSLFTRIFNNVCIAVFVIFKNTNYVLIICPFPNVQLILKTKVRASTLEKQKILWKTMDYFSSPLPPSSQTKQIWCDSDQAESHLYTKLSLSIQDLTYHELLFNCCTPISCFPNEA